MKKILVTGGTGFVGSNVVRRLVREGYKPILLIRKESNLWRIQDILSDIKLFVTDILSYESLIKDIKTINPTHIFHLAVYGAYQSTQKDLNKTIETNIIGTANLLNAAHLVGAEYFINTGSSSEYGLKEKNIQESDILSPVNYYGVTKASTTLLTNAFSLQNKMPTVTLRLFSPYGLYEDVRRFVPTVLRAGIYNTRIQLSDSSYVRDFVYIDDVVDAYMYFLDGKKYYGEIINIGSGQQTKLGDFVNLAEKLIGKKIQIEWSGHASNQWEPKQWQADISKAKTQIKWTPKNTLETGIQKTYQWFKKN